MTNSAIERNLGWTMEILANLIFLTKLQAGNPEKVLEYMSLAEQQLTRLNDLIYPSFDDPEETEP